MAHALLPVPAAALADHLVAAAAFEAIAFGGSAAAIWRRTCTLAYRTATTRLPLPILSGKIHDPLAYADIQRIRPLQAKEAERRHAHRKTKKGLFCDAWATCSDVAPCSHEHALMCAPEVERALWYERCANASRTRHILRDMFAGFGSRK